LGQDHTLDSMQMIPLEKRGGGAERRGLKLAFPARRLESVEKH
jgi:hypothetical protein